MHADSFGILDSERDAEYSKTEIRIRYITARLNYLRATDELSRFFHATDVLYFRRIGKFTPKQLGKMRKFVYALLRHQYH